VELVKKSSIASFPTFYATEGPNSHAHMSAQLPVSWATWIKYTHCQPISWRSSL